MGNKQPISLFTPGEWIPINENKVKVGLGLDYLPGNVFDLDGSVTAFNECNEVVESVYYHRLKGLNGAIRHYGDNLTGEGSGDDEVISIHLNEIPSNVYSLAVTVNSFKEQSIIKAKSAYIRLFKGKIVKKEIGRYILNQMKDCIGMLLGLFERDRKTRGWFFRVMADPIEGNVVSKSYNRLKQLLNGYSE